MSTYIKKLSFVLITTLILVGSFAGYRTALAVVGEGTANIDGGAAGGNVTVAKATSHKFIVVLTVGASGISADAENPTFTIPTGFTAPDHLPVANAGLVVADGNWSFTSGATCVIDSPAVGHTVAVGQVITADVTSACTVGPGGIITITYQGQSATAMAATPLNIGTNDVISYAPVKPISAPPTITVTEASATLKVVEHVITDSGGTATTASAWTLAVASSNGGSGTGSALGNESGTTYTLQTGSAYSVKESGGTGGYIESDVGDCTIAVAVAGTAYVCTITNDDVSPTLATLRVTKTVTNTGGGTKGVSDFPLLVGVTPVTSGVTYSFAAGTYTVTETTNSKYLQAFSDGCDAGGHISLVAGQDFACTITNTYIPDPVVTSASGSASLTVPPLIDVVKIPSPLALPAGPGPVTYTYTLRNMGTVPVTNITMIGDTCSPIVLTSGDINNDAKLDVNETWVYHCAMTLSKTTTNTVTTTGWASGIPAIDVTSATVVVGLPVVPPLIHVTKVPSVFTLPASGGTVTYTYTVTNPGTAPLSNVSITDDKCTGLPGRVSGHPGDLNKNNLLEANEIWKFTCQTNLTQTTTNTGTASGEANGLTAKDFALATVVVANNVVTTTPGLPKTGFPPEEKNSPWNYAMNFFRNLLGNLPVPY